MLKSCFSKFYQKRTGLLQYKTKIKRVLEELDMNAWQVNVAYISEFPKWDKLNDVPLSNFAASSQSAVKRKKQQIYKLKQIKNKQK